MAENANTEEKEQTTADTTADTSAVMPEEGAGGKVKKQRKKPTKKQVKDAAISWILMTVGTILVAAGVYFFKAPNHFATGGVSGISIILAKYVPHFKQSYFVMIINVALLILGFIFLGNAEGIYTLTNQPLMELVYAMLLTGIGSAIMFNCKASSGGTDIVALILKKYTKLNTGKALLLTDSIIACCAFVFGPQAGLFSILGLFSKAFIIDGVIENIGKSKYITIITTSPEPIADYILNTMKRDFTSYEAKGGYTGAQKTVLITVCKRGEALRLKSKVKLIDGSSFVIITDANEILGKGFRETL